MRAELWSAVARNRFVSHLKILQTSWTSGAVGFLRSSPEYRNGLPKRFRAILLVNSENVRQTSVCRSFRQYAIGGSQRQTEVCRTFPPHIRPTPEFSSSIPSNRTPKAAADFDV